MHIPNQLRKNVTDEWGSNGDRWLSELPSILEQCRELWSLELRSSMFELSYNYVTTVKMPDGSDAILKIGYPHKELFNEVRALRLFNGRGIAQVLKWEESLGAFLLERINPGTMLAKIQKQDDEKATLLAAPLLRDLPIDIPDAEQFPTIFQWCEVFTDVEKKADSPMPAKILERAKGLLRELEQSKCETRLLHGDLHHENILLDEHRGWLCIDPKGLIGDPVFNAARFLNDPRPRLIQMDHLEKVMARRIEVLASVLRTEKSHLAAWAFVDCILSACWWIESGGNSINYSLRCAELFEPYLKKS